MLITEKMLLDRQQLLQKEQLEVTKLVSAYAGAIENNAYWLDMLKKPEETE